MHEKERLYVQALRSLLPIIFTGINRFVRRFTPFYEPQEYALSPKPRLNQTKRRVPIVKNATRQQIPVFGELKAVTEVTDDNERKAIRRLFQKIVKKSIKCF